MTTIYQRLSPLGFAEWLENHELFQGIKIDEESLSEYAIDSLEITIINSLAFRWLREEKDLECNVTSWTKNGIVEYYYSVVKLGSASSYKPHEGTYDTHPLAEIACLEKAEKIIEQNK
jgi:hypothetical protein